jgi:ribose 5-phosphate isomerase B
MHLAIGNDHAGLELKKDILSLLDQKGHTYNDCGTYTTTSCDYPDFAIQVCLAVQNKEADFGLLICGTGIGMSIVANKHVGIRASLVQDLFCAKTTREHNNSNVLCLGARLLDTTTALSIVTTWLETPFEGGRHQRRLDKISKVEEQYSQ